MLSIVGFIVIVSLLVFIHEFGHYYVAKIFGVKIQEFSIGFGKALYSTIDKQGVRWKICVLPFGGYVKMYGYDLTMNDPIVVRGKHRAFSTKPLYARFLIVAAGPIANYLLAIIIYASFHWAYGKVELPAVIHEVVVNSPAARSGLIQNDKIINIDGKKVNSFADLQKNIFLNPSQSIALLVERMGKLMIINVIPDNIEQEANTKSKILKPHIGIIAKDEPHYIKMNISYSISQAFVDVIDISSLILKTLNQLVIGKRSFDELGGPITIAQESGKVLSQVITKSGESLMPGFRNLMFFIAMLSINLGLLNLLPIPILDGGHLMFIIYEAIIGKPLNQHIKNILLRVGGIVIIIFLIVIPILNDIKSFIS